MDEQQKEYLRLLAAGHAIALNWGYVPEPEEVEAYIDDWDNDFSRDEYQEAAILYEGYTRDGLAGKIIRAISTWSFTEQE